MDARLDTINALFVETNGPYFDLEGVIPWDINRDAKTCTNGFPAVAHPPCERWGRYWGGGPSASYKRTLGDDAQCFAFALWYVRAFGGVIEHPEASHAFKFYGLAKPPKSGGWIKADDYGGWACCVEQGNYGHPARKATWLYANKTDLPELIWGASQNKTRIDPGFRTKEEGRAARLSPNYVPIKRISARERLETPAPFKELLISIVRTTRSPAPHLKN